MFKWLALGAAAGIPFWILVFQGRWADAFYWTTLFAVAILAMVWLRHGGR